MLNSIKARLTLTICGILLLVFTIQMVANFMLADSFYEFQKIRMMKEVYKQIQIICEKTDLSMDEIIRGLDTDNNLEIYLADSNMNLIYSNRIPEGFAGKDDPHNKISDFDFSKYPSSYYVLNKPKVMKTDMMDFQRLRLFSKLERSGENYYIAFRLPLRSISDNMKSTNIFILYISTIAVITGSFLVYFISKKFVKPIEEINRVAIHVSKLDFSTQAKVEGRRDELGSLAYNINIMSKKLEENIENLKEANRKLENDNEIMNKIDEQRKELIANISHELKTPLAILSGYTEMLSKDVPGIDKSFYYETIQDETYKMNLLIQSLLNVSDMENRLNNKQLEEIDTINFVKHIYQKSELLLKNQGIIGEFLEESCKNIIADPFYLEEAINNYISNAINYTQSGKRITLSVKQIGEEAVISVFNEGKQIDEEHLEQIWNSFYRADKSRTRTEHNNIGLGLYIVSKIMLALDGKCGVTNRDNGVEFWVSLKTI